MTTEKFKQICETVRSDALYRDPLAFGIARIDRSKIDDRKILQASFGAHNWNESFLSAAAFSWTLKECGVVVNFQDSEFVCDFNKELANKAWQLFCAFENQTEKHPNVSTLKAVRNALNEPKNAKNFRLVFIYEDTYPKSIEALYLKLYALSLKKTTSIVLEPKGLELKDLAWGSDGKPIELEWLKTHEIELKMSDSYPLIASIGKFPPFLNHIIPDNMPQKTPFLEIKLGEIANFKEVL
ncbi:MULTISPECIES: tetrahydrodipicolinate N-succinyltransferase N-terminal domain-containing protein [unclassified Campylobacter]|uniref:tetrahydrodipicolinate N-succinyltransferase N-terminal domain-containing protein n=1 Tax=unclassified Campylobacter TaxID=2593542 RepID=UPI003D32CFE7